MNHVNLDHRPGFYRNATGEWLRDRRVHADRRDVPVPLRIQGMRTLVRRATDREMLDFLQSHGHNDLGGIEYAT